MREEPKPRPNVIDMSALPEGAGHRTPPPSPRFASGPKPPPPDSGSNIFVTDVGPLIHMLVGWKRGQKAELARRAGVSRQFITDVTGCRKKASLAMAEKLCAAAAEMGLHLPAKFFSGQVFGVLKPQLLKNRHYSNPKRIFPSGKEEQQIRQEYAAGPERHFAKDGAMARYIRRMARYLRNGRKALAQMTKAEPPSQPPPEERA